MMKRVPVGISMVLIATATAAIGRATFPPIFQNTYNIEKTSNLGKKNCFVCHTMQGFKLNPYGLDIQAAMKAAGATTLTSDILKSVEAKDSDQDGVSNIDEIKADTLPGDPNSKPAGH